MKHYDSIIIGHITKDINIDHLGNAVEICGGAVLFSSASAYALGHRVAAVTKLAQKDFDRLDSFTIPCEDIYAVPAVSSVDMKNQYFTADKERRKSVCSSRSEAFNINDLPENTKAEIYHFAGLLYGDFPDEMIKACAQRGKVAVDVQACLRHADADGSMHLEDWKTKKDIIPYITYLKTDAVEAEILTGTSDRAEAAKILHSLGAKEVIITHNTEVLAYDGKRIYTCPIKARNLSGRTGRGDTTFAAYINERLTHSVEESLLTATATVSLKMEAPGPLGCKRADVEAYINEFYK